MAQRFDLHGNARLRLPMVVDLRARQLLWTDLTLTGRGYGHDVARHADQLARAAAGSITLTVTGLPGPPWTVVRAEDLVGRLGPMS